MKHCWALLFSVSAALAAASPQAAHGQIFTPAMLPPRQASEMGAVLSAGFGPSGGLALEGLWRRETGTFDLGLRGGIGSSGDGAMLLLGAQYRNPLELETAPVDLAVTGGVQAAIGDRSGLGLDAGLSVGSTFTPEGLVITPYLHPRVALVETLRNAGGLHLEVLADLGVDLQLQPGWTARLALGLGGSTADFAVGLAWQ